MNELKAWNVDNSHEAVRIYRAPSTQGVIRADKNGISFEGNLSNITAREQAEVPALFTDALAFHNTHKRAFADRAKAAAQAETPAIQKAEAISDTAPAEPASTASGTKRTGGN